VSFPITAAHLAAAGVSPRNADRFIDPLNLAMIEFQITTGERPAMFLAQVAHESGGFQYTSELWGPTPQQLKYDDNGPLARRLGNSPGEGYTWRGHGLIQITGYYNHKAEALYFNMDVQEIVTWLQTPVGACRSAGHYWQSHRCNEHADKCDFIAVTKAINGGLNGLEDRLERYKNIVAAMA
jgi:putative chitinase